MQSKLWRQVDIWRNIWVVQNDPVSSLLIGQMFSRLTSDWSKVWRILDQLLLE